MRSGNGHVWLKAVLRVLTQEGNGTDFKKPLQSQVFKKNRKTAETRRAPGSEMEFKPSDVHPGPKPMVMGDNEHLIAAETKWPTL